VEGTIDITEEVARSLTEGAAPKNGERLLRNRGDGTFSDVSAAAGLGFSASTMGANFGDLDNDGWAEVYLGTGNPDMRSLIPNRMIRNVGGQRFEDVTFGGGFGHLQKGHGVSFADLDGDGDLDVLANMVAPPTLSHPLRAT
jgi:hypothetical protein